MTNFSLTNKIALITGSSRGIGFEIAKIFAENGALVILTSRKEENLINAKKEIEELGGKADYFCCHFGKRDQINYLIKKVIEKYKQIDILVNNMGINPVVKPLIELEFDIWEKVLNHNLTNYYYTSQSVATHMIKQGHGKIINISSNGGIRPYKGLGAYCIVKSAINMLTRVLALELADYNIHVNSICPGFIQTGFHKMRTEVPPEKEIKKIIPLHYIGESIDVAYLALFLASDASKNMTGELLVTDGGYESLH